MPDQPPEQQPQISPQVVSAAPTKRFFISVLIRDIQFIDALVELVDNSVDSVRSHSGISGLAGIVIELEYDETHFQIHDNAFGIPVDVAKHYAFRFGRSLDAPATRGAVGEFGVGMKRALFKIGRHFTVTSHTDSEYFTVEVDVDQWEAQPETDPNGWTFALREQGKNGSTGARGTTIVVDRLTDYAIEEFKNVTFGSRLNALIKEAHAASLTKGLQITINRAPVLAVAATLKSSEEITPIVSEQTISIDGKDVHVRLIAGVGEGALLADAGWNIYCNGRQIERAEKTEKTGWNSALDSGDTIPKPHWQFRRFRGYLFFDSDFQDVLPWNTTKTGLNVESFAYRRVRADMNSAMLQVISFLNALDAESDGRLEASVKTAAQVPLEKLAPNPSFKYKAGTPIKKATTISYSKEPDLVDTVKKNLKARNNREVGELTFDYYVDAEGLNGG